MILVDANLLIYASVTSFPQHADARRWFDDQLSGPARVGLPWSSLLAFLRIVTNPRVFEPALPMGEAWSQVAGWLRSDVVWTPSPTERHGEVLATLLAGPGVHGNLVHDADLAALALEHGLELCSTDGDFARFPKLRWVNPLASRVN